MMKKMVLALLLSAGSVYGQAWGLVVLQPIEGADSAWYVSPTTHDTIGMFLLSLYAAAESVECLESDERLFYQQINLKKTGAAIKTATVSIRRDEDYPLIMLFEY